MRPLLAAALLPLFSLAVGAQVPGDTAQLSVRGPLGVRLDSALTAAAGRGFSGVVLAAKGGAIVLEKGYGMANRAARIPLTAASVVQIGSNTKDFTAVAILQLFQKGVLGLDDSIEKFFPDVPADRRGITVRDLLTHRSGLPQNLGGDFEPVSRDQLIARAMRAPLLFTPGAGRSYSNAGYSLLAAIIEQLTGESYDRYVRDNILVPLGLHDTGFLLPGFAAARQVHGYRAGADYGTMLGKAHADDGPYWNLRGNGGMLATVSDVYRFYQAVDDGRLLRPAVRDVMFPQGEPVMLAGSDNVSVFVFDREPDAGVTLIIATNATDMRAMAVRDLLAPLLGLPGDDGEHDVVVASSAAPVIPDTPAGRAAAAYVRAFNSGDTAVMRSFIGDFMSAAGPSTPSVEARLVGYRRMYANLGVVTVIGVGAESPERIAVRVRAAAGGTATLTFEVQPAAPHRVVSIRVERD